MINDRGEGMQKFHGAASPVEEFNIFRNQIDLHGYACAVLYVTVAAWNVAHFVSKKIVKTNFI